MMMKKVFWIVVSLWLTLVAYAGVRAIERPQGHVLTPGNLHFATHEECVAAAVAAGPGDYVCRDIDLVKVEGFCDDVPPPPMPVQTYLNAVECPTNDNRYMNMVPGWVRAPYPTCWAAGDVPIVPEAEACAVEQITFGPDSPPDDIIEINLPEALVADANK